MTRFSKSTKKLVRLKRCSLNKKYLIRGYEVSELLLGVGENLVEVVLLAQAVHRAVKIDEIFEFFPLRLHFISYEHDYQNEHKMPKVQILNIFII